jgi:tetratricopeptide (TPR) repeat protein
MTERYLAALEIATDRPVDRDSRERELDRLLQRLSATRDADDASDVEMEIWSLWAESGSRTVNFLLDDATNALRDGELDRALTLMNAVIEWAPRFPEGWNRRATIFMILHNNKAALKDLRAALALEPRHFGALWSLSLIHEAMGDMDAAIAELNRARALNPHIDGLDERLDHLQSPPLDAE